MTEKKSPIELEALGKRQQELRSCLINDIPSENSLEALGLDCISKGIDDLRDSLGDLAKQEGSQEEFDTDELLAELRRWGQLVRDGKPLDGDPNLIKEQEESTDVRVMLSKLKFSGRVKMAMFGNSAVRDILIRDSNKILQAAVLQNPRIRIGEIESFAKNSNLSQNVLRAINRNKKWTKSYAVKYGLVSNPKTPNEVAMRWIKFLNKGDLRKVAKSKNMPQVVVLASRKRLTDMEKK